MTAVEFWRDIEARFRALQSRSHDSLYAVWLSTGWSETGDQWRLRGADRTVRVNFEWSAERAAVELGHHGGRSAVVFWLDLLKHESPNYKVTGSGSSDNGVTRNEHGKIKRVCEASADYCLRLETQGIAKGAIRMSGLSRGEIEKFADDTFAVARDRILAEYAEKLNHAPAQARLTGNSGAYLPTVIRQAIERSRAMILARAASYVEAFNQAEVPSDKQAEKNLETFAHQSVAGSISKVRGELRLRSVRLRKHPDGQDTPWHLEIERARDSALKEGLLALRRQRIEFKVSKKENASAQLAALSQKRGGEMATTQKHKRRLPKRDPAVEQIKVKVRDLRARGLDYKSICKELGNSDRPPRATWRELPWPTAYLKHTSAVTKWLSEACSE